LKHGIKTKTAIELAVIVNLKRCRWHGVVSTQLLRVLMIRAIDWLSRAAVANPFSFAD
jgi:hypothetical protein